MNSDDVEDVASGSGEPWFEIHGYSESPNPIQDAAGYIDAATVALRYSTVALTRATVVGEPPGAGLAVTPRTLRDVMGCMATGVCVVTTRSGEEDIAMTANSVTSLSLEPPLVLVCIATNTRFHEKLTAAGSWGISILDATAHEISTHFARPGRNHHGQFDAMRHHRGPVTGVALLDSSVATIECQTASIYPGGDHDIFVGEVVGLSQTGVGAHPLIFHRGKYEWLS